MFVVVMPDTWSTICDTSVHHSEPAADIGPTLGSAPGLPSSSVQGQVHQVLTHMIIVHTWSYSPAAAADVYLIVLKIVQQPIT